MKKSQDERFQTHIAEPKWQQIVSVVIVLGGVLIWVVALIFSK
ncbi:MAG TPA: hypothetical protein VN031_00065 [Candidatus Microsaccharimonas sp.]|nr:hypothetical protein [Candidatus Microsaccharimonas sp.]